MAPRLPVAAALVAAALSITGCSHKIGDSCKTNVDCSPLGDRFCDVSAPGGYCTIEGCDVITTRDSGGHLVFVDTCPSEAVCVRFFEQIKGEPCDPTAAAPRNGCRPDERCLCDNAAACEPRVGAHCAPESSERRACEKRCDPSGSDCRDGYACRQTGTHGGVSVPWMRLDLGTPTTVGPEGAIVPGNQVAAGGVASFCVQASATNDLAMSDDAAAEDLGGSDDAAADLLSSDLPSDGGG